MRQFSPLYVSLLMVACSAPVGAVEIDLVAQLNPIPQSPSVQVVPQVPPAEGTVIYEDGLAQPYPTMSYDAYTTYSPGGWCGGSGNSFGSCFRDCWCRFDRCLENFKARLGAMCRLRPRFDDPGCCVPEPTCAAVEPYCGIEPGCNYVQPSYTLAEPLCNYPEPSCHDIEYSCAAPEVSCGIAAGNPSQGFFAGLRSFCARIFGRDRQRNTYTYYGDAGCPECGNIYPPEPTTQEVYEMPIETGPQPMVPVPSVNVERPASEKRSPSTGGEDRVAIGSVRLTLNRLR